MLKVLGRSPKRGKNWSLLCVCIVLLQAIGQTGAWKDDKHSHAIEYGGANDGTHPLKSSEFGTLNFRHPIKDHGGESDDTSMKIDSGMKMDTEVVQNVAGEGRLNKAYFNTLLVIVAILVAILTLVSNVEIRLQSKDKFMTQAFDICVRQVVIMSLVTLGLYMVMHTDLAERLDYLFTRKSKHIEVFDTLLQISFFLFCVFFIFCIYIGIVVSRGTKFIRAADEADVVTTAKEYDFAKNSTICCFNNVTDKTKYLVSRMEFTDMVKQRGYSDNCGCYFMDYMRASLIQISMTLLKISRSALFIALVVLVVLKFIGTVNIFRTIYYITILNTLAIAALASRIAHLDSQLYPLDLSQYLLLKLNVGNVGDALQPLYMGGDEENTPSDGLQSWLFGDGALNAHQNIFWLKQYGPAALKNIFGTLLFSHLMILSVWMYCLKSNGSMMFQDISVAAPLLATAFIACLIPKMLYSLVVVTRCGHLIDFELLENILVLKKTENAKNATELIDALSIEAVRYAMVKGGDEYWRMLLAKQKALPPHINERIKGYWDSISNGQNDVKPQQVLKYLQSQWGTAGGCTKQRMTEFISQFMRHDPKRMNLEEFMVFGYKIKHMILAPLEDETLIVMFCIICLYKLQGLFEDKFEIPWKAPCGIDLGTFDTVIKKLNLKWKKSAERDFLEFISGGASYGLSPESLMHQLNNFQQACQKNYFSAL
ncbi:rhoptry neck protein 11 [Babesia ovis]|uniref:Rhoptry neck protein 11 n=1 Tax=Babesia ovis TaxID=5869 RepID=A0A9W5WV31_BABOV|nr:rhoptry neck protein 11 [Babesia ovis]